MAVCFTDQSLCEQRPFDKVANNRSLVKTVSDGHGAYGVGFMELVERGKCKEVGAGDCLFEAGNPATHLFLLLAGEAHLLSHDADAEVRHIDTMTAGGICGENALLEKNPTHSRTVIAHTDCRVLMIDKEDFEVALHKTNDHIAVDSSFGGRVLAFVNMVCPATSLTVSRGATVFTEGDRCDAMCYIINTGTLDVLQKDKFRRDVKTDELHEGECFGYISLLEPDPHTKRFTIKCASKKADLLAIDGKDFHRLMDHSYVVHRLFKSLSNRRHEHAEQTLKKNGIMRFRGC